MQIYLQSVRKEKNISIRELAEKSGVSKNYIQKIEAGTVNPTVIVMCKLAKALETPVYDLFGCEE